MRTLMLSVLLLSCGLPPAPDGSTGATQPITAGSPPAGAGDPSNPARCPAQWQQARTLCAAASACEPELSCWYPGVGDAEADGGWAPGLLACSALGGRPPQWLCAQ
jgi:hypothetical protein